MKDKILTNTDRYLIAERIKKFQYLPKLSLVTPVYNTKDSWLIKCIESVLSQVYENWELCLCANGTNESNLTIIKKFAEKDSRIKYSLLEVNKGIEGGSNSAIELATGQYIGFLDSDDEISNIALYLVAEALNKNPKLNLIYTDAYDVFEPTGDKHLIMKPDWSPDFVRSNNYLNHFSLFETSLVKKLRIRYGCFGSQDYDLVLRAADSISPDTIYHIPVGLYNWRIHSNSTSKTSHSYAVKGAVKALEDHLKRLGRSGTVMYEWPRYRIKYELPNPAPHVDIIVPSINKSDILHSCIRNILARTNYYNYSICLCVPEEVKQRVIFWFDALVRTGKIKFSDREDPFNFSKINNDAVKICEGPFICLYNDDIEPLTNDWLDELVSFAQFPENGIIGCKLLYPNLTTQHVGAVLGINGTSEHLFRKIPMNHEGYLGRAGVITNYTVVTAACCLMRKSVYEKLGGLDENLAVAFNDVDLCIRAVKSGLYNIFTPYARMIHYESFTRGLDTTIEKQRVFIEESQYLLNKHRSFIKNDPFYNPNASLKTADFAVADESRFVYPWLS